MSVRSRWTLAATILASSMTFIDATVVNVALPALQADLHATITDGSTGRRKYERRQMTNATTPEPPTMTTGGGPIAV